MVNFDSQAFVRRRAARLPVEWPALFDLGMYGPTSWRRGVIADVSPFGAFLRFEANEARPRFGDTLTMLVEIGGEPFLVEGVVRWCPGSGGAGVAFSPSCGEVGEALAFELAERASKPLAAVG